MGIPVGIAPSLLAYFHRWGPRNPAGTFGTCYPCQRDIASAYIDNKLEQNVYVHQLGFETRFRQPWGEIYTNLRGKAFLQDHSKNNLTLDSWFSIRIFEGLSIRFGGEIELIRDQLSLPKGNASIEDLLLQQKEIATDFRSEFRIGISYTFGSAFNNYLNSRL